MRDKLKALGIGLVIGMIAGSILTKKYASKRYFFITPKEVKKGGVVEYDMPEGVLACAKIIINREGKFDLEYYGK